MDMSAGRIGDMYGATFAMPATAEKGYLDVRIEVSTPGGHSSVPPAHTVQCSSDYASCCIWFLLHLSFRA